MKRLSIKSLLTNDFKLKSIHFDVYYQPYTEDTNIIFEYLPEVEENNNEYYVQNNGGYESEHKLIFGGGNSDNGRIYINTKYPLANLSFSSNNNDCSTVTKTDTSYLKPSYIDFLSNSLITCSIMIERKDFENFCNSFDTDYKIFSNIIRNS